MFKKDRVIVVGSFAGNNFGDTLVLVSIVDFIQKHLCIEEEKLTIPTTNVSFVRKLFPRARVLSMKLKNTAGVKYLSPQMLVESIRAKYVLTTAGILFDYKFWHLRFNFVVTLLPFLFFSKCFRTKVIGFHVGVSPSSYPPKSIIRFLYQLTLKYHNRLIVRDLGSFNEAIILGYPRPKLSCSCDIAFYTLLKLETTINDRKEKVFINLTGLMFNDYGLKWYKFRLDQVIKQITQLSQKYEIIFFSTEKSDTEFINSLSLNSLTNFQFKDLSELRIDELGLFFNSALFAITSRMHATIITTALKIPTITFNYHPKVLYYMESIDMGNFALNSIDNFDEISESLVALNDHYRGTLAEKMTAMTNSISKNNITF